MTATLAAAIDLRDIDARERLALIVERFEALPDAGSMQLVADRDPKPIHYELHARWPGRSIWSTLESGPGRWRVEITKVAAALRPVAADSCCSGGACCG